MGEQQPNINTIFDSIEEKIVKIPMSLKHYYSETSIPIIHNFHVFSPILEFSHLKEIGKNYCNIIITVLFSDSSETIDFPLFLVDIFENNLSFDLIFNSETK